jgi:hypothetical protein
MRMSHFLIVVAFAATSAAAQPVAPPPALDKICLDPHRDYQARAIGDHDIVAHSTLGHDHREVQLTTTCIDLTSAFQFSLSSNFNCMGQGDTVVATTADGRRQSCIVTRVQPYVPNAGQPGTPSHL